LETPKKGDLRGKLMTLDENPLGLSTDDIGEAKSNAVQIHNSALENHYKTDISKRSDVIPRTGQFMNIVSNIVNVSKEGAVATNLHESMSCLGHRYAGMEPPLKVQATVGEKFSTGRNLFDVAPTASVEENFAARMPLSDKYKNEWTHTDKEILPSLEFMW
jgi:hypothetical protein